MAFMKGDLITASGLYTVNRAIVKVWSYGHAGWSWADNYLYWYCTRPANDDTQYMVQCSNSTSYGNQKKLTLWRMENGTWAQKNHSDTASGTKVISWPSYGAGTYKYRLNYHNNTPTVRVYPCKFTNVRGALLGEMSVPPFLSDRESSVSGVTGRAHDVITAAILNNGQIYTL